MSCCEIDSVQRRFCFPSFSPEHPHLCPDIDKPSNDEGGVNFDGSTRMIIGHNGLQSSSIVPLGPELDLEIGNDARGPGLVTRKIGIRLGTKFVVRHAAVHRAIVEYALLEVPVDVVHGSFCLTTRGSGRNGGGVGRA